MLDIITVGETLVSFTPEEKGDLCYVDYFKKRIAGSESNVAIGACKLRHSAGWVSRLGDDSFGDYILNMVRSEGVDVGGVIQSQKEKNALMFKEIRPGNETAVMYYRKNSAASCMKVSDLNMDYILDARMIYLSGITSCLSDTCRELNEYIMEEAQKRQIPVAFDPNIRKKMWEGGKYKKNLGKMLLRADVVMAGLEEIGMLFDVHGTEAAVRNLTDNGRAGSIAVKNGGSGAVVTDRHTTKAVAPYPCRSVDTVGAGDAFNAAFLCGLLEGKDITVSGYMGVVAGALTTETGGDTEGFPKWERMDRILNGEAGVYR